MAIFTETQLTLQSGTKLPGENPGAVKGYTTPALLATYFGLGSLVPNSRTVNGQALTGNITIESISGNAGTATALQTARTINGVSFNGTANITVPSPPATVVTESTTARTLALADGDNKYIRLTHADGCAITVPPQASVAWAGEVEIPFRVAAAGSPSIVEGAGVTVHGKEAAASLGQHKNFLLKRVAEDEWDLI